MEPGSKITRVQCPELSFWEEAGLNTHVAVCMASLGAVGVAIATQKSTYDVTVSLQQVIHVSWCCSYYF